MAKKIKKLKKTVKDDRGHPAPLVTELVSALDFTHEGLPDALLNQAKLYFRAAQYRVTKLKARIAADTALKETRVVVAGEVREEAEERGTKITEKYVAELVDGAEDVKSAQRELDETKGSGRVRQTSVGCVPATRLHGQGSCTASWRRSRNRVRLRTGRDGAYGSRTTQEEVS